jgi:hypothetical protein
MGGKTTKTEGTKVGEIQLNNATYGLVVSLVLGTSKIPGNVIDYYDFTPISNKETQHTGKGGGKTVNTTYTYTAAVLMGLAEGPGGVGRVWTQDGESSLPALNLTVFGGVYGQPPWQYTTSRNPVKALPYSGLAYVAGVMNLGDSGSVPQLNFEFYGMLRGTGDGIDVNPADAIAFICSDPVNGVGFGVGGIDADSLNRYRIFCKAADLLITVSLTDTRKAYEIINDICKATNTVIFWSQSKLKLVPKCDERIEANGVIYEPDSTPLYNLTEDDFLDDDPLVSFERADNAEAFNHVPVEFTNRANAYETETVDGEILTDINSRGRRTSSTVSLPFLHTKARAQYVANLLVKASLYGRNKYIFKLGWTHCLLEPGDFVTIYDPVINSNPIPVLIDEVEENEDGELSITAIGRKPGANSAARFEVHEAERASSNCNEPPGDTIATVFDFSPEIAEGLSTGIAVSGGSMWGGCSVWVSDTGEQYQLIGTIDGPSRHGVLTTSLPAGEVLDRINNLKVQLYRGQLASGTQGDAQNLNTLCWVDGELIAYATATLTGDKQYSLTYLVRGAYNTPIKSHVVGSKFVRLDSYLFRYPFTIEQLGKQVYLKLTSRNVYGIAEQSLADVEPISYILTAQSPPDIENIVLEENTYQLNDGTVLSDIKVTFDTPTYLRLNRYDIYYSLNGADWVFSGMASSGSYGIKALPQALTIQAKVVTVSKDGLFSNGAISESYKITGKDTLPSDIPKLVVTQTDSQLKATVTPSGDPDIVAYELRMGWSWGNSTLIKEFEGTEYTFPAPSEGTLTFFAKAIDRSRGKSKNATKAICTVFGLKPTNVIYEQNLDLKNCTAQDSYPDIWCRRRIQGVQLLTEFEYFSDFFESGLQLKSNPQLTFSEIDLGPNILEEGCFFNDIWGNMHLKSIETVNDFEYFSDMFEALLNNKLTLVTPKYATQTLLGITPTFNTNSNNRIDIDYKTRVDGDGWSDWHPYSDRQFIGRRILPRLSSVSIDGVTDVIISAVKVIVDVPDVEDIPAENIQIPAARTRIYYRRKFFNVPKSVTASTTDLFGVQATNRIDPSWITRDYFDIEIYDSGGNLTAGIIQIAKARGG